ncbi:ABC transporter ATP-binding protein [Porphyromonas levii]|uniref:ABC transporter ATP-binding protein n=1 Tax=Porphyromonas levii TaxID=28114 RepID=UPI00037BE4AB|nr:ABC transporter ATP-binding protein [Porphyromonas levii]MBR8704089.1 Fe(3+) dicitrate transport ATP-binding protein FecE [Porphyromonas levii]MBR8760519.1 Fe(3+) dicitrate transport ATP-binding protein FecE [Porphyromonas levii]MBR8785436.1 Fe(3+) dicitrate transport ATP-binding protein FecE [Porphyromonas levii]
MKLLLNHISAGYDRPLVKDGNTMIEGGQLVALLGRNGAGKSTLIRHIAGLLPLLSGEVLVGEKAIHKMDERERAKLISVVSTRKSRVPQLSAAEVVGLGRSPYTNLMGKLSANDRAAVREALELVGISHLSDRYVDQISDGENQRVMIARALAQDTPVILLDEPTAFLDLPNRYDLALLLKRLTKERNKIIIFSTHDLDVAFQLCDRLMLIQNHELITLPTEEMKSSGLIEALFSSEQVQLDPHTGAVHLRQI